MILPALPLYTLFSGLRTIHILFCSGVVHTVSSRRISSSIFSFCARRLGACAYAPCAVLPSLRPPKAKALARTPGRNTHTISLISIPLAPGKVASRPPENGSTYPCSVRRGVNLTDLYEKARGMPFPPPSTDTYGTKTAFRASKSPR